MRLLLCLALACGGASDEDEVLEAELEAEAAAGSESTEETGLTIADRFRAAETRVFEACYDEIAHLDDDHQRRRQLRVRLLTEAEVNADAPARVVVERESENAGATSEELPSNVDDEAANYSEAERELIGLENELDVFHGQHPDPDAWTDADLDGYENLADRLVAVCESMR